MPFNKYIFITLILLLLKLSCYSQSFLKQIDNINTCLSKIDLSESISEKLKLNDTVLNIINEIITDTNSFDANFDSIQIMGVIKSPDNLFKIYNWHIKITPDIYEYFAYIQYYDKKNNFYKTYKLIDKHEGIPNFEQSFYTDTSWYGALYYDIILKETETGKFYTLLGFDYNSIASHKKIIEILHFVNNKVFFGKPVFYAKNKIANHISFEYSHNAIMTLNYDRNLDVIIFDHLSPMKPTLEGQYQFYGPDLSYDGFKFENNKWIFVHSIDIRNPKKPKNKK